MWISSSLLILEELVARKQNQLEVRWPSIRALASLLHSVHYSMLTVALWVQFPHLENENSHYLLHYFSSKFRGYYVRNTFHGVGK